MPNNLMDIVKAPLDANPTNSVVAFKDNSSAIRGFQVTPMLPQTPGQPCPLGPSPRDWDLLLTAETHNFPCAVAPYPGAAILGFYCSIRISLHAPWLPAKVRRFYLIFSFACPLYAL